MAESKICVCPQCGKKFKVSAEATAASFTCSQCSATVWIDGKPTTAPTGKRSAPAGRATGGGTAPKGRAGARGGSGPKGGSAAKGVSGAKQRGRSGAKTPAARGAAAARGPGRKPAPGRGRGREEAQDDDGQGRRGSRQDPKNNSTNVILAVVGLLILIGGVAFFVMGKDDKQTDTTSQTAANKGTGTATNGAESDDSEGASAETPEGTNPGGPAKTAAKGTDPTTAVDTEDGAEDDEEDGPDSEKPTKLTTGGSKTKMVDGKKVRISKYNPPEDLTHLESTPADKRKEIDDLINLMFDPDAGRDGMTAKDKLVLIGKPAFLPILARMVATKKLLKWDRSIEDNQTMSSVRMADETLRRMDGWVEAKNIQRIVPGSDERYYDYVLRIYYRRWVTDLKDLETMPGEYDPSVEYKGENEEKED